MLLFLPFFLLPARIFAQERFAPFVSSLRIMQQESSVRISWQDDPASVDYYSIYRYTDPINETTFPDSTEVGRVDAGDEEFTDYPPSNTEYYYAILAVLDKEVQKIFIPYRNVSVNPIAVKHGATIIRSGTGEEQVITEVDRSTTISDIRTDLFGDFIILRFSTSRPSRDLLVYRHHAPIQDMDLDQRPRLVAQLKGGSVEYREKAQVNTNWYYGVFDKDLSTAGTFPIIHGQNVTSQAVRITVETKFPETSFSVRPRPLPELHIVHEIESGRPLVSSSALFDKDLIPLSEDSEKVVNQILKTFPRESDNPLTPVVLEKDTETPQSGSERTLTQILNGDFSRNEWSEAALQLRNFLSVRREKNIDSRARFYLGQAYYFMKEYRKAFLEFLNAQENYYTESQPWIDDILVRL